MFDHTTATYVQLIDRRTALKKWLGWYRSTHAHDPAYVRATWRVHADKRRDLKLTEFALNMTVARAIETGVYPK